MAISRMEASYHDAIDKLTLFFRLLEFAKDTTLLANVLRTILHKVLRKAKVMISR